MKNRYISIVLLSLINFNSFSQINTLSIVKEQLKLSEKAIYDADFSKAEELLKLDSLLSLDELNIDQEIALLTQYYRIQLFKKNVYMLKADPNTWKNNLNLLLNKVQNVTEKEILADYYNVLSSVNYTCGNKDSADFYLQKAKKILLETLNFYKLAELQATEISRTHIQLQNEKNHYKINKLIPLYKQEIAFSKKYDNKYALAFNIRHLGQIYNYPERHYAEAFKYFKQSMLLREEIEFKPYLPASYSSVGDMALHLRDVETASIMYRKTIQLADEIEFIRYQIEARIKLGDIFSGNENPVKAKIYYKEAFEIAKKNNYKKGIDIAQKKLNRYIFTEE